ncbi:MAG TPA: hypothetical protein DHV48_10650 [Prolixibacteraceae bacterium]|nr:hypothetical protein [Prolixibacteraceae bacterium]
MKRNKLKNGLILTVITAFTLFLVFSCEKNQEEDWIISSDKCVFVDHHVNTNGELIEGNYQGGLNIDFPTYNFNQTSKILKGEFDFEINKSLKIIYGNGKSLSGVVGAGAATVLYGGYDIPYAKGKFEIKQIDFDGTVHIQYNDSLIVLKNNEEWVNVTSEIDTQDFGEGIAKANIITTDKIVNYGIIEKSKIEIE